MEAKERGKTFQLNNLRESLPPLHQNKLNPVAAFDEGLETKPEHLVRFFPTPSFEDARELITMWEAEPIVIKESICFNQSAESARRRKFDSNCQMSINNNN